MKNMKIEINAEQPLDEVVRELERLGYVKDCDYGKKFVYANGDGSFDCFIGNTCHDWYSITTLQQLREMDS